MAEEAAHLMLLGVGLVLLFNSAASSCITMADLHLTPTAPSSRIKAIEFPDEEVLPIGSNVTIQCISNVSKEYYGNRYYVQPFWIQFYLKDRLIKYCGGRSGNVDSEDSKECTFFIQNATVNDSGEYECWSHNQFICTKDKIKIEFKEPSAPFFTVNTTYQIYFSAGSQVNMSCEASGVPMPVVTWYKDGIPVPSKNTTRMKGLSLLTLKSATAVNQGEYWCEARNSEGWKRSPSTRLSLNRMPTISLHPKNVSVYFTGDVAMVTFSCKATGSPRPVIGWLKNNSTEANGTVIQTGNISSLFLVTVNKETTAGKYSCVAKNSVGEAHSMEGTLVIFTPRLSAEAARNHDLSFYRHPESITVSPGDHVTFTCAVEGSPVPEITWLKDGMTTVDGKAKTFQGKESSTSVLTISSVGEQHVGNYACQATNLMGSVASKEALLSLTGDISTSTGVSKLLWISVSAAAVLLVVVVILIFVIRNKYKKAELEINTEINKEQRYSNFNSHEGAMRHQSKNNEPCAAPHYQMANVAMENAA